MLVASLCLEVGVGQPPAFLVTPSSRAPDGVGGGRTLEKLQSFWAFQNMGSPTAASISSKPATLVCLPPGSLALPVSLTQEAQGHVEGKGKPFSVSHP